MIEMTDKLLNFVRRKPIRTSKNNSGSQQGSSNGGGVKKGANKIAKPLSYDNYSTDTSSQFSADIVECCCLAHICLGVRSTGVGSLVLLGTVTVWTHKEHIAFT